MASVKQSDLILKHLRRGPITAIEALNRYGCFRLAARVKDLRNSGHDIVTEMVKLGDKKHASYYLRETQDGNYTFRY